MLANARRIVESVRKAVSRCFFLLSFVLKETTREIKIKVARRGRRSKDEESEERKINKRRKGGLAMDRWEGEMCPFQQSFPRNRNCRDKEGTRGNYLSSARGAPPSVHEKQARKREKERTSGFKMRE